ncbi:MAG: hypothetical protein P1V33_03380 [Pseudohongiella nitratireducens]|nr:hypothetical protein [Pseudohongiella nitratireducens]MDF1622496.1 hypothetical protein [Pseudohongiella nitratireducens]
MAPRGYLPLEPVPTNPPSDLSGDWYPGTDQPFLIQNVHNVQDGLCTFLFVCLDNSLPDHIVARPVIHDSTFKSVPVILPKARFRFSPGDAAVTAMGLKDEVTKVVKVRHQHLAKPMDA